MLRSKSRADVARRPHAAVWLWSLALVMGGAGAALHLTVMAGWASVTVPPALPWWVLAVLFAVAETMVIHVQIRHDSHTLSLTEIPIVLGLALAAPVGLIAGRLVGSAIALVLGRRQPPVKLAFNLGLFYLEITTALLVYRSVLGSGAPLDPMGWLAALAAVVAIVGLGLVAVITAISIHDPSKSLRALIKVTPVSTVVSLEAALFGLLAAFALAVSLWAAVILIPVGALFIAMLRSYGVLIKRHDELQAVYEYVQEGESGPQDDQNVIEVITSGIVVAAKASACALVIIAGDQVTVHRGSGAPEVSDRAGFDDFAAEIAGLADLRACAPGREASMAFDQFGLACAYVLKVELEEAVAAIVVGPKVGQESEYGPSGKALIETLAASAAARLRRFELVRRLRAEIEARQDIIRSKDQLVASVSHELRTPMTTVLGFADLLRSNAPRLTEDERLEMLQAIVEQSVDITNILEDLLTVARSDSGSLTVQLQAVDLLAEARAVVSSLGKCDSRSLVLVGAPIPAIADPNRVRQVLRNLVVNARRHGGDSIRVEVGRGEGAAYVRVVDDGPGVSTALCDRMFEPYVRTRGSPSQPASVGLGLTISRRLARLMGGDITYRRSGGETTFELTVPMAAPGKVAA